jgi:hypothetical protein
MTDRAFFEQEFPGMLARYGEILDCATVASVFYAAVRQKDSGNVWAMIALTRRDGSYYNFSYKEMADTMGPAEDGCPVKIIDLLTPLPDCRHDQEYCQLCGAEIAPGNGQWLSRARPGQHPEVAGPRCYSGYLYGAKAPDGGKPFHEPGGIAPCSTCSARDWRDRCRANAEASAAARARAKAVRPGSFVRFASPLRFQGDVLDTFIFEARSTFRAPGKDLRYRIRNWRTRQYEVIDPPQP